MIEVALAALVVLVAWLALTRLWLDGSDLSAFDAQTGERFGDGTPPSPGHAAVVASLGNLPRLLRETPRDRRLAVLRENMDGLFPDDGSDAAFRTNEAGAIRGEWATTPGADPRRRTLYIHGGAFTMGSPRSHRRLAGAFSRITGGAVFAVDYRLMPEHRRIDGIEDCRDAYRWLLENGPDGSAPASQVVVAGDSAGGNLALSLAAWVRDASLRAPDAVVALSPLTDATMRSPSLRANLGTDPMLGPMFAPLARMPRFLLLWVIAWQNRMRPCDPRISPARGDLSRLPPTLVQASDAEMLRDDARRYVNRAMAAGSPARLQMWAHMVHAWQLFHPELREGREALEEVRRFVAAAAPAIGGQR